MRSSRFRSRALGLLSTAVLAFAAAVSQATLPCGPFTDLGSSDPFCPFVVEIFTLGITTGLTPTLYDPASSVTRLQMAAFLSRTVDSVLKRGSKRAALGQFWALQTTTFFEVTTVGNSPHLLASDGTDVWAPNYNAATVSRVRGGDGRLLETWTGAGNAAGALSALGDVFVTGNLNPGLLYRINPRLAAGVVTTVASNLGTSPYQLAFDGGRIWTANVFSISIVTPGTSIPWTVTTVTAGLVSPQGVIFDGANVWVTDTGVGKILRLDSTGAVLQTVTVGTVPYWPIFDGANIWVPNNAQNSVSIVHASNGAVLATLTGNGLSAPTQAAFDGERVLVTNNGVTSVSLWKAASLTAIGSTLMSDSVNSACSDGVNFWISLGGNLVARY